MRIRIHNTDYDWLWLWLWLWLGVGIGAGAGICLELEQKPGPEISKMGGSGNPGRQCCGSVSFWYRSGSRIWKNLLRIRIRIQGELWYGSGSRKKRYGSGSSKKGLSTRKIFKKCMKNAHNLCFVGVYYFTITCLQLIIQISVKKLKLFYVFNGFSWIRIRIIWYGSRSGFRIQPFFDTDPDPGKWYGFHGSGSATLVLT